ncbi:hypothetical protein IKM56_01430 [Candidatus Saccharibacteria bacterium]|jgi:hypothetical protein|nr:hypothetical protein [Candidatus Saccharibacteria bacterium]
MEQVNQFIDSLIDEKGLSVDGDVREELRKDMADRLMTQIDNALINALPSDKVAELNEKLDDPNFSEQDTYDFINNSGIDTQRVILETMMQFKMLYVGADEADEVAREVRAESSMVESANKESGEIKG